MKKKFWMSVLAVGAVVLLAACGSKGDKKESTKDLSDWAKIEKQGELVVGVDDSFVPMGYTDDKGNIVGFDIDLATALCEELGIKAKIQPIDWKMKETELSNGTIDVIWNGYTITKEREEKVAFSNPYLKNEQVIMTLTKDKINSYDDLSGKVLGAQEESSGYDALEAKPEVLLDKIKDKAPVTYASFNDGLMDLDSGRIQGLIIDSVYAEYYISHKEDGEKYKLLPSEFEEEDYAVGIRKSDTELLKKVNETLKALYDNGKTAEISKKWLGEDKVIPQ